MWPFTQISDALKKRKELSLEREIEQISESIVNEDNEVVRLVRELMKIHDELESAKAEIGHTQAKGMLIFPEKRFADKVAEIKRVLASKKHKEDIISGLLKKVIEKVAVNDSNFQKAA